MAGMSTQFDNYTRPSFSTSTTLGRQKSSLGDYAYTPGARLDPSRANDNDPFTNAFREAQALTSAAAKAGRESGLAAQYLGQFLSPGTAYAQGREGSRSPFTPEAYTGAIQLARKEEAKKAEMAGQEASYDKAYAEAIQAQEMARTGTGVFQAGSAPQTIIGGAQGAGVEKTGRFKSMYGAGSMLPASWMRSRFDPTQVAKKVSGIEDRQAGVTIEGGGGRTPRVSTTLSRSKFVEPTLNKTGLGKYATIK
jgi:hypothetical protein